VPQHVNKRAQARQRCPDHRFHCPHLPGAGGDAQRGVDVRQRIGRTTAKRAADRQRSHQRRDFAELDQPGHDAPLRGKLARQQCKPRAAVRRAGLLAQVTRARW
jgi:hypothetical protein